MHTSFCMHWWQRAPAAEWLSAWRRRRVFWQQPGDRLTGTVGFFTFLSGHSDKMAQTAAQTLSLIWWEDIWSKDNVLQWWRKHFNEPLSCQCFRFIFLSDNKNRHCSKYIIFYRSLYFENKLILLIDLTLNVKCVQNYCPWTFMLCCRTTSVVAALLMCDQHFIDC